MTRNRANSISVRRSNPTAMLYITEIATRRADYQDQAVIKIASFADLSQNLIHQGFRHYLAPPSFVHFAVYLLHPEANDFLTEAHPVSRVRISIIIF